MTPKRVVDERALQLLGGMSVMAAKDNCPRDKREVVARVFLDLDDRARSDGRQKQRCYEC